MQLTSHLAAALFVLAPLAMGANAGIIHVGGGGPGSYPTLKQAVAAAAPGDTILVAAGAYGDFGAAVVDKSLTILGAGASQTSISSSSINPTVGEPALVIRDLQPGDVVRVAGMHLQTLLFSGAAPTALWITNNQGAVHVSNITSQTGYGQDPTEGACIIENSIQVSLDDCQFAPWDAVHSFVDPMGAGIGQAGLFVSGSTVDIVGSDLAGSNGLGLLLAPMHGGAGIKAVDSTLRISRSNIRGGFGSDAGLFFPALGVGDGGAGVLSIGSNVFVRGGAGNAILGGAGGGTLAPDLGAGGAGLHLDVVSLGTTTPDANLVGGLNGGGATSAPGVLNLGVHVPVGEALATLGVAPIVAAPGKSVTLTLGGAPGSTYRPYFSFGEVPALDFPGFLGVIVVNPAAFAALPPSLLDAAGAGQRVISLPAVPALVGSSVVLQGLGTSTLGTVSFSSPVVLGMH